jgi:GGDEF domain-containing protein
LNKGDQQHQSGNNSDNNIIGDDDQTTPTKPKLKIMNLNSKTRSIAVMIKGINENKKRMTNDNTWSILFCDIDGLKLINDTFGHVVGDAGIKNIANIIKKSVRNERTDDYKDIFLSIEKIEKPEKKKSDKEQDDKIVRFGGDEFIVISPNCTKKDAQLIKNRINRNIAKEKKSILGMSLSIGIADTNEINLPTNIDINNTKDVNSFALHLISLAEKRMDKEKKEKGRNLPIEEKTLIARKYINRMADNFGLDINDQNDQDELMFIIQSAFDLNMQNDDPKITKKQ